MENWEDDTDALLMQLPATGCVFRKTWYADGPQTATISALDLVVPVTARNLKTTPRITEKIRDVFPHEITGKQRLGYYRDIDLALPTKPDGSEEKDGTRLLLEQHCLWDFDDDGLPEPYIVTVDHQTRLVLRIEPNFGPDDIEWRDEEKTVAARIRRRDFYVKYGMFPHPAGKFYDIGLGHLLKRLGDGVDTMLNQLIDAGTAQTAGGGFIGSGVRLQSRGARGVVRFSPGEYKTVDVSGDVLKNAIVEKTLPDVSPVTFQLLELILGAAKDIAGIKDVMTGEASNQGQVGTTLALIEQGLQVFNATAKRVFRSLKNDYELLFDNIAEFGGEAAAKDYAEVLDDPEADFAKDFDRSGLDIRPVSDPSSITRMQKMAKAQFMLGLLPQIVSLGGRRARGTASRARSRGCRRHRQDFPATAAARSEAGEIQMQMMIENLRKLSGEADDKQASATEKQARAMLAAIQAQQGKFELGVQAGQHGMELGAAAAHMETPA
jgi:chaperonin GroES